MTALPLFLRLNGRVDPRFSKDFFFVYAVAISLILFGIKTKPKKYVTTFAVYFLSICYINQYHQASITISYQMTMIICGILLVLQTGQMKRYNTLLNGIAVMCVAQACYFILQKFGYGINEIIFDVLGVDYVKVLDKRHTGDVLQPIIGSLGQSTISGALIAITLPSLFRKKWVYLTPMVAYGIYLSGSSMTLATSVFITGAYIFREKLKYYLFLSGALVLSLVPFMQKENFIYNGERFKIWIEALNWLNGFDMIFGKGLGYFHDFFSRTHKSGEIFRQAHNEFIELYIIGGIIAVGIACCFIYTACREFGRVKEKTPFYLIFIASLFNSLASFPYHISSTALVGLLSLGIILKQEKKYGTNHI